jgi:hypothetical protein
MIIDIHFLMNAQILDRFQVSVASGERIVDVTLILIAKLLE